MWSNSSDVNLHTTFVVCVYADETIAPPLLIVPVKQWNGDVMESCNIEGAHVTTSPKCFINYNLFLNWVVLFAKFVPDSVARQLVLVC